MDTLETLREDAETFDGGTYVPLAALGLANKMRALPPEDDLKRAFDGIVIVGREPGAKAAWYVPWDVVEHGGDHRVEWGPIKTGSIIEFIEENVEFHYR